MRVVVPVSVVVLVLGSVRRIVEHEQEHEHEDDHDHEGEYEDVLTSVTSATTTTTAGRLSIVERLTRVVGPRR